MALISSSSVMAGLESLITLLLVFTALLQMAVSCLANAVLWFAILWQKLVQLSLSIHGGIVPRHPPPQIPKSVDVEVPYVRRHSTQSFSGQHSIYHPHLPSSEAEGSTLAPTKCSTWALDLPSLRDFCSSIIPTAVLHEKFLPLYWSLSLDMKWGDNELTLFLFSY